MNITQFPLGQMRANCYLLEDDGKCLLIDPGDTADFLLEQILRKNLELVGIIATHGHFDHIMAVGEIQLSYPHVPLHIHPKDEFLLKRVGETAEHFLGYNPSVIPIRMKATLTPGKMEVGRFSFEVIHTPGHSPGSCCIYFPSYAKATSSAEVATKAKSAGEERSGVIFTGDTLFQGGIGRYDFSYSDKDDLKKSLEKILKLPEETIVYSGHGEETQIEDEQEIVKMFF